MDGVCAEYAKAATRDFGPEQGEAWVRQFQPETTMWRIAVVPEHTRIIDFETRLPSALS